MKEKAKKYLPNDLREPLKNIWIFGEDFAFNLMSLQEYDLQRAIDNTKDDEKKDFLYEVSDFVEKFQEKLADFLDGLEKLYEE